MSATKLVDPKAPTSDEQDEQICLDFAALQAGAKRLFLSAIKAHVSACGEPNKFTREDAFAQVDGMIGDAERLLAMAKAKAEQTHPEEE